ncbi:MAG TPA: glycosyltransferase, partial [Xanthobacteraceae bacterium]|nr:glycosyltransferase [Xanthobacteraceae bacterium]
AGNVCFVGVVTGNLKIFLLQNSLVNLMPSRQWEGFPLVILESFAAGRPLIVTQIPGSAGLVRHLETGWLVNPDSPDALANAIRTAIADGPTRERLGLNARAEAVRYDWKIVAAEYLKLFATLRARTPL